MIGRKVSKDPVKAGRKSKAANVRHLTDYITAPDTEEKVLFQASRNFVAEELPAQQQEMITLAERSVRSRSPVSHYILSWREGEQPTAEQAEQALGLLLEELGLEEHQAIYALHRDTDNLHMHVAVNRVHPLTSKVVRPNNNFDVEALHRAVARIEHEQGWQSEAHARYRVREDGEVVRRSLPDPGAPREPRERARDYEQRTGAKSAERIAIEEAAPILRSARSWQELHAQLQQIGARLEQKGSGGLLWIDGQPVKPSAVDRQASLTALQKRLGPYQPPKPGGEELERGREGPDDRSAERDPSAVRPASSARPDLDGRPGGQSNAAGPRAARPVAEAGDRVHDLQGLHLAEDRRRTAVLLPRDVPGQLEQGPAHADPGVRRRLPPDGGLSDTAFAAALPVLRTARSWAELHAKLEDLGLRYERKGSGAVLRSASGVLKASSLERRAGLGAMERRLGSYKDHTDRLGRGAAPRSPPAPTPGARPLRASPAEWGSYIEARREHYKAKAAAQAEQRSRHDEERRALREELRARREHILAAATSRPVRQALRSVVAAEHARRRADERDRMLAERAELRAAYPRFPDLEEWLRARNPAAADRWRYRASSTEQPATRARPPTPAAEDIRSFVTAIRGGSVYYHHRDARELPAAFVDRGRAIHVHDVHQEAAVLASLQLASQKWGRLHIAGDDAYKALAARLAVEHGFQLDNKELQGQMATLRAARASGARPPRSGAAPGEPAAPALGQASGLPRAAGADPRPPVHRVGTRPPPEARGALRSMRADFHEPAAKAGAPPGPAPGPAGGPPRAAGTDPRSPVHGVVGTRPPPEARGALRSMRTDFHEPAAKAGAPPEPAPGRTGSPPRAAGTDPRSPVHRVGTRPPPEARGALRSMRTDFHEPAAKASEPAEALPRAAATAAQRPVPSVREAVGTSPTGGVAAMGQHGPVAGPASSAASAASRADEGRSAVRPKGRGVADYARAEFDRYHAAVQAERYRVTAIAMTPDGGKKAFILDKVDGVSKGFTPSDLRGRMRELARLEARGENLYYTPLSDSKHHILVDDMNREKLERLVRDGYRPAVVLESSPGNYQAVLTVPKLGSPFDREIGNRLSLLLNREYGDPNLSGAVHPHRVPGLENRKPKHQRADSSFPEVRLLRAEARECERALRISKELLEEREVAARRPPRPLQPLPTGYSAGVGVDAAYDIHYQDIAGRFGSADASRVDAMIALRLRATGHDRGAVAEAIERSAPAIRPAEKRDGHVWRDYAERTVQYAFGPAGDQQLAKTERHHAHWRRMEGQAAALPGKGPRFAEPPKPRPSAPAPDLDTPDV